MKQWPRDDTKLVMPPDGLIKPLLLSVQFLYDLKRKNERKNVPYSKFGGYNTEQRLQVGCYSPEEALKAKNLAFDKDDQGREAIEAVLYIALQLGCTQGMRDIRSKIPKHVKFMRKLLRIGKKHPDEAQGVLEYIEQELSHLEFSIQSLEKFSRSFKKE